MGKIKKIGVLTSEGDVPGRNAAIGAVVRAGMYNGFAAGALRKRTVETDVYTTLLI